MRGAAFLFLALKKLKGGGIILKAARHNRRDIPCDMEGRGSIDPALSASNETLHGPASADAVAQAAKERMIAAGLIKTRKDAVLGLELVASLPPDHEVDGDSFFRDCLHWAARRYGGMENVLSADVHRDESRPHIHILILPLINGRMVGSSMMGNRRRLADMRQSFQADVGRQYGLALAPERLHGAAQVAAAREVLSRLMRANDPATHSQCWWAIRDAIERDAAPYLELLGMALPPAKKLRSMAQIFTSKGKGPARDTDRKESKPIGFLDIGDPTLCPVGFPQTSTAENETESAAQEGEPATVRIRDRDLDPSTYDPDTGEFRATGCSIGSG